MLLWLQTQPIFLKHQVEVLSGKDKGRQGRIVAVARSLNRVFVGGLNTVNQCLTNVWLNDFTGINFDFKIYNFIFYYVFQHTRILPPNGDFPGARIPSEAPLHISNVAIVDPVDG